MGLGNALNLGRTTPAAKRENHTVIASGLKVTGSVTADGTVEIKGQIEGIIDCVTLIVGRGGKVAGRIVAERLVVDGLVEGPIQAGEVMLKSNARILGDIACQAVLIERGASVEGRLFRSLGLNGGAVDDADLRAMEAAREAKARLLAASELATRKAELVVEARHLTGNPDLSTDDALAFLAKRGNSQAKALLSSETE